MPFGRVGDRNEVKWFKFNHSLERRNTLAILKYQVVDAQEKSQEEKGCLRALSGSVWFNFHRKRRGKRPTMGSIIDFSSSTVTVSLASIIFYGAITKAASERYVKPKWGNSGNKCLRRSRRSDELSFVLCIYFLFILKDQCFICLVTCFNAVIYTLLLLSPPYYYS